MTGRNVVPTCMRARNCHVCIWLSLSRDFLRWTSVYISDCASVWSRVSDSVVTAYNSIKTDYSVTSRMAAAEVAFLTKGSDPAAALTPQCANHKAAQHNTVQPNTRMDCSASVYDLLVAALDEFDDHHS